MQKNLSAPSKEPNTRLAPDACVYQVPIYLVLRRLTVVSGNCVHITRGLRTNHRTLLRFFRTRHQLRSCRSARLPLSAKGGTQLPSLHSSATCCVERVMHPLFVTHHGGPHGVIACVPLVAPHMIIEHSTTADPGSGPHLHVRMLEPCDAGDSSGTLFPNHCSAFHCLSPFWSVFYPANPVINAFLAKHFLWILG